MDKRERRCEHRIKRGNQVANQASQHNRIAKILRKIGRLQSKITELAIERKLLMRRKINLLIQAEKDLNNQIRELIINKNHKES